MNGFEKLIRVASVEQKDGVASLTARVDDGHLNDDKTLHGGFVASLLDSVSGYAGLSTLPSSLGLVAVQFSVNFIRVASGGELRARAQVIKPGMQVLHIASELSDQEGALLAQGQGIWLVQRAPAVT